MSQITPNGLPDDGCLSFLFGHLHVIGRPVFSRPRFKRPSEKFDEPKTLQMHHSPLRRNVHLPDQPILFLIRVHQTIAFQPCREKKPAEGGKEL